MSRSFAWIMCLLAVSFGCPAQQHVEAQPVTVIHAGALLAVPGKPASGPSTIVVRGDKILLVTAGLKAAAEFGADSRLIDLSDKYVLPGLIDLHMHLAIMMNADSETVASEARLSLAAASYAARLLQAGVTTVRDTGDNTGVVFALRDSFAREELPGPRLFAAGRVVSRTGGHGAKHPAPGELAFTPATCDGPESCRRVVRENVEQGSDWIKVTVSGSGREVTGQADSQPILFPDEMTAIAEAARQAGRPMAAHAHSTAAINLALESGVRTIEHGTYFDSRSVALFKSKGAFLVPTAFVADYVRSKLDMFAGGTDGRQTSDLEAWANAATANPGRAWRAGIPLGLGTDGGPSFEPDATAREVELYVKSGVPAAEAIKAATTNGAVILGMGEDLGKIAPGFLADLIAVDGDPVEDASRLRHVDFVMKAGIVRKSDHGLEGRP
jgi:imidazolonepropionase-like amidohydrolase